MAIQSKSRPESRSGAVTQCNLLLDCGYTGRGVDGQVLNVIATRIREKSPCARGAAAMGSRRPRGDAFRSGDPVQGIALRAPSVGLEWVLYCEGASRRIVTSPIQRIMRVAQGHELYIETRNSVYRLCVSRVEPSHASPALPGRL